MTIIEYAMCPCCGRSERKPILLSEPRAKNSAKAPSSWTMTVLRGLGRGKGFANETNSIEPDPNVIRELRRRCKAFLKRTRPPEEEV